MGKQQFRGGSGTAFRAVDHNDVNPGFRCDGNVVTWPGGPHLEKNRYLIIGCFAQFLNFDLHVIGAEEVRVTDGRPLINALRQRTHRGHSI